MNAKDGNNEYHTISIPVQDTIVKPLKTKYISKVLNIVLIQLLITLSISMISYYYKEPLLKYYVKHYWLIIIPFITSFVSLIIMASGNINNRTKYSLLAIFTLSMAVFLSLAILPMAPQTLIQATAATIISILSINICASYYASKGFSFDDLGTALFGVLCGLMILSIIQIFVHSTILGLLIASLGICVFTGYLLYDLNLLYNKPDFEEDPIMAALVIYLDIINLFMFILELFVICSND